MAKVGLDGHDRGAKIIARALRDAGMDVVIYETMGVGQGEVEVASAAGTVVLCLQPGAGDSVQALKAGVMEIADIFCMNKSDHPRAKAAAAAEVRSILELGHELDPDDPIPPIVMTRGDTGEGIQELKEKIEVHRAELEVSGELERRRRAPQREFVVSWATNKMEKEMQVRVTKEEKEIMDRVYNRELDPISASEKIFDEI